MDLPKVLIFGQPFNNSHGGGITLTNLFKKWPKENIAVLADPFILNNITTDICNVYYQIGREEYRWKFPFNLYKETYSSGLIDNPDNVHKLTNQKRPGIKNILADKLLNPVLQWLGMPHCMSKISLSTKLTDWLSEFKPDILYIQVARRESILFATSLIDYLMVPSVIHMMDDWPSTISTQGRLKNYWNKKIDREFKQLLNKVDLHLSICDAMSEEYKARYGHEFIAFHNTIDLHSWTSGLKTSFKSDKRRKQFYSPEKSVPVSGIPYLK